MLFCGYFGRRRLLYEADPQLGYSRLAQLPGRDGDELLAAGKFTLGCFRHLHDSGSATVIKVELRGFEPPTSAV